MATSHGSGITGDKSLGPGRQIYDKSYYQGQLRQRVSELRDALQRFNGELVEIQNDNNVSSLITILTLT